VGVPALVAYPATLPFRIVAASAGLILLPLVSRATARWDPPRPLRNVAIPEGEDFSRPTEREGFSRPTEREGFSRPTEREDFSRPTEREDFSRTKEREGFSRAT